MMLIIISDRLDLKSIQHILVILVMSLQFLCHAHRSKLAVLPEKDISAYWFEWMMSAGEYYEQENWEKCASYAGCAYDLSSCALLRADKPRDAVAEMTLAGVYLINVLLHLNDRKSADIVLDSLQQKLAMLLMSRTCAPAAEECLRFLGETREHPDYFRSQLSLAFHWPPTLSQTSLH